MYGKVPKCFTCKHLVISEAGERTCPAWNDLTPRRGEVWRGVAMPESIINGTHDFSKPCNPDVPGIKYTHEGE